MSDLFENYIVDFLMMQFICSLQELHAHINGSISETTMEKLVSRRGVGVPRDWRLMFNKGDRGNLDE